MNAFHNKPKLRKLARTIVWTIPAFTLPFFVGGVAASGYLWPLVVIVYSAFVVGLGYCDTHLLIPGTVAIDNASPGRRFQFAMGFYGLQIFTAPIILILIVGLMYLGTYFLSEVLKFFGIRLF